MWMSPPIFCAAVTVLSVAGLIDVLSWSARIRMAIWVQVARRGLVSPVSREWPGYATGWRRWWAPVPGRRCGRARRSDRVSDDLGLATQLGDQFLDVGHLAAALRFGGSTTLSVAIRGATSTPSVAGFVVSSGFFFAFMMFGSVA